ncbi:MAG: hypothetical protein U0610_08690 [bacterium]
MPLRYYAIIVRGVLLKGAGFATLWPQALVLVCFATAAITAALRFRKSLTEALGTGWPARCMREVQGGGAPSPPNRARGAGTGRGRRRGRCSRPRLHGDASHRPFSEGAGRGNLRGSCRSRSGSTPGSSRLADHGGLAVYRRELIAALARLPGDHRLIVYGREPPRIDGAAGERVGIRDVGDATGSRECQGGFRRSGRRAPRAAMAWTSSTSHSAAAAR